MPITSHGQHLWHDFSGILGTRRIPAADLEALGLDPRLATYANTGAWTPGTHLCGMTTSGELDRVTTFTNRALLSRSARRVCGVAFNPRLPMISYLRSWMATSNVFRFPARLFERSFSLWSGFHEHVLPVFNKWIVFALAAWPLAAAWRWCANRTRCGRQETRARGAFPPAAWHPVHCVFAMRST